MLNTIKTLAILGASGHGKVVADAALCSGFEKIVFFDDDATLDCLMNFDVIGNSDLLKQTAHRYTGVVIAIGNNQIRWNKVAFLNEAGIPFATIIHPRAVVSRYATIGEGTVVFAGAVINPHATIGRHCIINTNATVEHDCVLADGVHISPGASLGGGVKVGKQSWVGIGASIREYKTIGCESVVAAGAAVVHDIPDGCLVAGVPAVVKADS